jgi:hypothetical protein
MGYPARHEFRPQRDSAARRDFRSREPAVTASEATVNGRVPADGWPEPGSPEGRADAVAELRESLTELLRTLLRSTVGFGLEQVQRLAGSFDVLGTLKGSALGAVVGGLRAGAAGDNPIWGAFRGAVAAMSTGTRVALVLALVLAIVLLPVTVVLVLLALIVAVVVVVVKG